MKINTGLLSLALGAFAIGTTEFAPMGLLPLIASDLGVSIPKAGLLISAFALGVVISAPVLALVTSQIARRRLLIIMTGILVAGNALSAISDTYSMMLYSRIVTALNMGTFFGVGAVVAAGLVPKERQASAVAVMFMGLALSNVLGVPLATWAGEQFGWRAPFWAIAILGLVTMGALRLTLPVLPGAEAGNTRSEIRALMKKEVILALSLTALGATAWFSVVSYITPILRDVTQTSPFLTAIMLVIFGAGLTVGNWLGGRFADRSIDNTLIVALAGIAVTQIALAFLMPYVIVTAIIIFFWAVGSFAIVPPLQMRVIAAASEAPNLASSVNISAFNTGNALGAAIGGGVIATGAGYPAVAIVGALVALVALGMVLALRKKTLS
ncbi:MFS transporter [Pectobacterium polonicum]|uniref:MFS transporter n=1 Tax=Pectobacterium polonicum TaxID=2485124 RepID=UPI0037542D91